jgi:hypothetical protein
MWLQEQLFFFSTRRTPKKKSFHFMNRIQEHGTGSQYQSRWHYLYGFSINRLK